MRTSFGVGFAGFLFLSAFFAAGHAVAWGERGHHVICEVATQLVREEGLRDFMDRRSQMMGHVCNIPDIAWRQLGEQAKHYGDQTHFLNWETFGVPIESIPLDYRKANALAQARESKQGIQAGGTLWWRADQFFRRAVRDGARAKASPFPDRGSEQDVSPKVAYNYAVNWMVTDMGLMGHFVGDAAQPYHNVSDYDGYASGHGGIHSYYESMAVDRMSMMLIPRVHKRAQALRDQGTMARLGGTLLERMRGLSRISAAEVAQVERADRVLEPSRVEPGQNGKSFRQFAKRPAATEGARAFEDLVSTQMARAATLLALAWDEAYVAAGRPDLSKYKSYQYPLAPKFVVPDYLVK